MELNRVNGNLALSRAVGDFSFKQNANLSPEDQIVSGCPDVVSRTVSEDWEFILLACDGIWDVLSNQVGPLLLLKYLFHPLYEFLANWALWGCSTCKDVIGTFKTAAAVEAVQENSLCHSGT